MLGDCCCRTEEVGTQVPTQWVWTSITTNSLWRLSPQKLGPWGWGGRGEGQVPAGSGESLMGPEGPHSGDDHW